MGSNNYAEVITDTVEAQKVVAAFERLVQLGRQFKALEFDPDTDRFAISCGRESNFPPHPDVENGGATLAPENARALWKNRDTVAVSFGNGLVGLLCESDDGQQRMLIPANTATAHSTGKQQAYDSDVRQQCQFGFVLGGHDCDRPGTDTLRATWFYYPDPNWNVPLCPEHKSAVLAMACERWLHDCSFEPKQRIDRSGACGAPAAGLISWDCELGHDAECDQIGCPGYELMPACARCLENPNDNDVAYRDPK